MGALTCWKGYGYHWFLLFVFWLSGFRDGRALKAANEPELSGGSAFVLSDPPIGLFGPIEISPAVVPRYPYPLEPLAPMYPSFPATYQPVLTGRCPVSFSLIDGILDKTASDCIAPLASLVGNVICCPQVYSLLHIFQGVYSMESGSLVLNNATANDCFSDIMSILSSRGANNTLPLLCSVSSSNLTGGSCPVKDAHAFEKMVNTSKLLDACGTIDPLKECCRPLCQPAILDAAVRLASTASSMLENGGLIGRSSGVDVLGDCKRVVYAWLSKKLSPDAANTAYRMLSGCKVNRACPLQFKQPTSVIEACKDLASMNPSCCSSLNAYITSIQKQMLITNRQALNCATMFGSMLKKGGVKENIYELCGIDLKDFSLQANGLQGCLLRSLPTDVVIDNSTGVSFTCDLSDNIAAPWPLSSSLSTLSLCAPEMSLPALPSSDKSGFLDNCYRRVDIRALVILICIHSMLFIKGI
ncbi:hypothetical protein AMTRI_Chr06g200710 [Amborella trichopoda]|uniref:uncharacterized GPI-anchored protein At1g61900 n=1 Tax=Amborella trichopoda TaxID=13333 RepID=UPI0005D35D3C|nr:uncharacterized GPI-anchored protein At1g61900 [Amborella trichopoda]|eukprot:XP_011628747.1 uncharacterized GPI-anchored protein At1g61900 [Amborella trichopoda]